MPRPAQRVSIVLLVAGAAAASVVACGSRGATTVAGAAPGGSAARAGGGPSAAVVRVDQVGYPTGAPKRAVALSRRPVAGEPFTVRGPGGGVVLRGRAGRALPGWNGRYRYAAALDLTALRTPGRYVIALGGRAPAVSPSFAVAPAPSLYAPLVAGAVHFLRGQRDGSQVDPSIFGRVPTHLADAQARLFAPARYRNGNLVGKLHDLGGPVDVSGGWMDAGDTLKYAETSSFVEVALLKALRDYPAGLGDAAPQVRAEAAFGLDWLLRLWDPANHRLVYQVGLGDGNGGSILGAHDTRWRLPQADDALKATPGSPEYYVKYRPAFVTSAPVSPNLAGRLAAAYALGAQVLGHEDPALHDRALAAATSIYAAADAHPHGPLVTAVPHAFYPEAEWRDDLELAAAELALATAGTPASTTYLDDAAHWAALYGNSPLNGTDSLNLYDTAALAHGDFAMAMHNAGLTSVKKLTPALLLADLQGQEKLASAASRDAFGYAGNARDDDVVSHALGWSIEAGVMDALGGGSRYARLGATQRDYVLGANAWGTTFVVGAGSRFPHCLHDPVANLRGSLDGRGAILTGAVVPGPNASGELRGLVRPTGARRCPAGGGNPFAQFDGHGAGYVDNVASPGTSEPSIDLAGLAVLAFARAGAAGDPSAHLAFASTHAGAVGAAAPSGPSAPLPARVVVDAGRTVAAFRPGQALGAGLDGHDQGETRSIYTPSNVHAMASAGLGPISLRLRTELGVEAWHPSAAGTWSDPRQRQGYFTPSARPDTRAVASYGYNLPRRGDTIDQANDSGWSRLDDGRSATFWKSNPYLDPHYTHAAHPQWALVDLGRPQPVDAVRIAWGTPWATRLRVQWFAGPSAIFLSGHPPGAWRDFPAAAARGHPGVQLLRVDGRPRSVRFVRLLLDSSSHTAPRGSRDVRDRLGFAIRELGVGTLRGGRFADLVRHRASRSGQTVMMVSSTDPWHRATDRDPHTEQPGFATVMRSGLTRGMPVLVPVPVLYGTPAAAIAELRQLRAMHVPIAGVELGEEPDGQLASPEDYAALYVQFARAIHRYDPHLVLGGPGFQTSIPDWMAWPDGHGDRSWTHRFVAALSAQHALGQLGFFSFEWYPFDNVCRNADAQLRRAPGMLAAVLARQLAHGVPASVPRVITEFGFSAFAGRAEVDRQGALFDAETSAQALALGVRTAYFYGLEPDTLIRESSQCDTWGNLLLLLADDTRHVTQPAAAYWAMRLVDGAWQGPPGGAAQVLATDVTTSSDHGGLLTAYALRHADGHVALLLVAKSPGRPTTVTIGGPGGAPIPGLDGPVRVTTLSASNYVWHPRGSLGSARPDGAPVATTLPGLPGGGLTLPATSLTVVEGVAGPA